ncbi:MAG: MFS transporter [Actinobacteria bacterium]|nr:MFS transporter [Actinomycetota bacterium]MCL5447076.1 MFS transporter [Actinomycetota bacterium]
MSFVTTARTALSRRATSAGRNESLGGVDGAGRGAGAVVAGDGADYGSGNRSGHPDLALLVVMTGVLITAVDTTIVVLALPEIERALHISLSAVIWVIIGYLLVITILAMQVGRLGDMFGRVRMYKLGFLIFIIGSFLCALSFNEMSIILFRVLQGAGGALIQANSGAVVADTFPPEKRGRAYGFIAVGWSIGAVLGIVLGGLIITYISWRWIFWINVPIGLIALVAAGRVLVEDAERGSKRIDWGGMILLGGGLFCLLWAMTKLTSEPFDLAVGAFFAGGLLLLAVFLAVQARVKDPVVNLSIFRIPTMTPSLFAALVQATANYAVLFLLIMYLQGVRGLSPLDASLLLVPGYVLGGIIGPFAGKLADRTSPVFPATAGLGIQVVALLLYANLGTSAGLWMVVLASVVNGIGGSAFFPGNNSAVMKASTQELFGISSGMLRTFSNVGMVFSFAMAILVAARTIPKRLAFAIFVGTTHLADSVKGPFNSGIHSAFYASAGLMVFAAVLSASRVFSHHHIRGSALGPAAGQGDKLPVPEV